MLHLYCKVKMDPLPSPGTFRSAAAADTIWPQWTDVSEPHLLSALHYTVTSSDTPIKAIRAKLRASFLDAFVRFCHRDHFQPNS